MLNIVCLKWGDKFTYVHVNRLYKMVKKNLKKDFTFTCHTENADQINPDIKIVPLDLSFDLEKWWWKLTLFKDKSDCENIFFDLDVVIQNDITHFTEYFEEGKIRTVKAYWKPWAENALPSPPGYNMDLNSSIMIWKGNLTEIWDSFIDDPEFYIFKYNGIDSFLYFHHNEKINWLPEGAVYSRIYGYDKNNWYQFNKGMHADHKLFYRPEYNICIFNGLYGTRENMVLMKDEGYQGFEQYWSD